MTQLLPCPSCARHVRRTESSCPFCSAAISLASQPARRAPAERLGRAATLAFGAAVATSLAACSSPSPTPPDTGGANDAATAPDTGSPDVDGGGVDAASPIDANVDTGTPVAAYGGPMFDSGDPQDSGVDTGAPTTLYGGPGA